MTNRIENQQLTETVPVRELLTGTDIGTWQADYPLTGRDYEHLRNGKPVTYNWANSILLTSIGVGLNIIGKYISQQTNPTVVVYESEWWALGLGVLISGILYGIGSLLPNDRKLLMKKLKEHFDNSPKKRQLVQESEQ